MALFELGLAQGSQHLVMAPQLSAELGDVTVGQRSERAGRSGILTQPHHFVLEAGNPGLEIVIRHGHGSYLPSRSRAGQAFSRRKVRMPKVTAATDSATAASTPSATVVLVRSPANAARVASTT